MGCDQKSLAHFIMYNPLIYGVLAAAADLFSLPI